MYLPDKSHAPTVRDGGGDTRRAPLLRASCCPPARELVPVFLLLLIVAALLLTPNAAAQPATKKILILTGSDPNHPGFSILTQRVRSIVRDGSPERVEFVYELQEGLVRPPPSPRDDEEMVSYFKRKYGGGGIDLILAAAAPRLRVLMKNDPELFAGVPKVFYEFDEEREAIYRDLGPNITGVWAKFEYGQTLDIALTLQPDARRVVVIAGGSPQGSLLMEKAKTEFRKYEGRIEFTYLTDLTLAELKSQLAALPRNTIVLYLVFYMDRAGNRYPGPEALSLIAPTSGAPIYGNSDTFMGQGIVGGSLLNFDEIGKRLGEMCLRVLRGEKPGDIPSQTAPSVTTFDWRELRRWGISEQSLPPGSVVRFRQSSFWELYKWYIIGLTTACILEALLIAWLLFLRVRRRQAEERSRAILQAIPDLMFLQTRDGVFRDYHATDPEGLYAPPETFIGKNVRDVLPPELAERFLQSFQQVNGSDDPQVIEYELTMKGQERCYEARLVSSGGNVLSIVRDITERKAAEAALQISESRLRMAQQAARIGSWEWDIRTGKAGWSEIAWQLLGLEPGDGEPSVEMFTEFVHPEDRDRAFRKFMEVVAEGEEYSDEFRIVRRDGRVVWLSSKGRVIRSASGQPERVLGVNIDITERKQAELALRDAMAVSERDRAQLESIFQTVADGIIVSDMAGNVLLVNEAMARLHEYERPEEMKRNLTYFATVYELFYPDGRLVPYGEWPLSKVLRGESVADWELRLRRKDTGREWFLSYSGEPVRDERGEQVLALLVTHDITERRAAEEALRQSEARFRNMADTAPVMIWIADTDKLCTYVNKQWLDFTGRSMDEELGNGWTESIHPDDYDRCLETFTSASDRNEPFKMEYRLRRADGVYRWVLDTGTPRLSSGGEFLGYIGSGIDITGRKEAEAALQQMLEEVNRLKAQLQEENIYLREEIKLEHNFSEIVGQSDSIKYVLHKIEQVAPTDSTVLIMGETGTGKELVARAIHGESPRRDRPLVKVNCAALAASLIESELFGHERGAFTGAASRKIGRFELADRATIFLDEIGELPQELQVKLLRVIQEGELERLGSTKTLKVDVRIIAATNRNLWEEVQNGRFREDLFYRLNVFPITMPPLRQRAEDIPLLVEHFANVFSQKMGKKITSVAPTTMNALRGYSWPGNVRELANIIERAVINNGGPVLQISNISEALQTKAHDTSNKTLEDVEREYISTVLGHTGWRIEGPHGAAEILGLHPSTLRTRMAKLNIRKTQQTHV